MENVTIANINLEISRIEGLLTALKSWDISSCTIDGQKAL